MYRNSLDEDREAIVAKESAQVGIFQHSYYSLLKKALIDPSLNVTANGKNLLVLFDVDTQTKKEIPLESFNVMFKEYFDTYPLDSRTPDFPSNPRPLRVKEQECRNAYFTLLREGKIEHEIIMERLRNEIEYRSNRSNRERNEFIYMNHSLNYILKEGYKVDYSTFITTNTLDNEFGKDVI